MLEVDRVPFTAHPYLCVNKLKFYSRMNRENENLKRYMSCASRKNFFKWNVGWVVMTVDFKDSWSTVQTLVCLFCCFSIPNTKAQSTEMLNDGKILYLHCFFVSPKFACMKCDLVFTCRISYNQCCITKYFILENECYSSTALMLFILVLSLILG